MNEDILLSNARASYDFDVLRSRAQDSAAPPIGPFALALDDLHGYSLTRRIPDPTDGNRYVDDYLTPSGQHVFVNIVRMRSSHDAHEMLLRFLANTMASSLPQARDRGIALGDTAFVNVGDTLASLAFVRRNVFVHVYNATASQSGDEARSIALAVDREIIGAPASS